MFVSKFTKASPQKLHKIYKKAKKSGEFTPAKVREGKSIHIWEGEGRGIFVSPNFSWKLSYQSLLSVIVCLSVC